MFENISEPLGKQTEFLLKSVAERLAGREDCRQITYTIMIDHNGVRMNPLIYVYPNRYKRKETDKIDIISFVHEYKMQGALLSDFVFGIYEYSLLGSKRKWRKVQ